MIEPFRIDIAQPVIDDLRERIARTRWPDAIAGAGWERGTDVGYLRGLAARWLDYDWRRHEAALNELDHVRVAVDGVGLHAVRQAEPGALPVLLLHGWPDSFLRYRKVLPLLTGFDVVVPSLPGYGFSDKPPAGGYARARTADLMAGLMSALGHERFVVSGGDIGSGVAEQLGYRHPERLAGIHLTDVPFWHLATIEPSELTAAERAYREAGRRWQKQEAAYMLMQSTRPMTAALGLSDSPLGLAAWIVEKLRAWSDCDGDLERRFPLEDVLTFLTLYWVTNTIASSFGPYYEADPPVAAGRIEIPTAVTQFPHDLVPAPRAFAERCFAVRRWTELPRGGHFGAWEEPELFADELRAFAAGLG